MKRLILAAVGLALVAGIIIGGIIGNPFGATVRRTSAAAVTGSGCYTNWNSTDCAPGWTAVFTGEWTAILASNPGVGGGAATMVCAVPKPETWVLGGTVFVSDTAQNMDSNNPVHVVNHEACATCCATSASVVGGVAEPPDFAAGATGMGGGAYAVLGAVGGVLTITVAGTVAAKRRGGQQ